MDVSTQTAICYLNCPDGAGPPHTLLPCALFWETDSDLLVGWGDSFRHVEIVATSLPAGGDAVGGEIVTARNVVDWEADCIICGLTTFDADHVLVLGYAPPAEADVGSGLHLTLDEEHVGVGARGPRKSDPLGRDDGADGDDVAGRGRSGDTFSSEEAKVTTNQPELQVGAYQFPYLAPYLAPICPYLAPI